MSDKFILDGTLIDAWTVTLDKPLNLESVKVRVVLELLKSAPKRSRLEVLEEIHRRQKARGHRPPTKEEVDEYIQSERMET